MRQSLNHSKISDQGLIKRKQQRYNSAMEDLKSDNDLLVAVAQRRDQNSFIELFNRYSKKANSLAYHITADRNLAEEATQEGFLNIWNSAHTFRPEAIAKKWILCVVANAANLILRTRYREKARIQKCAQAESRKSNMEDLHQLTDEREDLLEVLRKQTLGLSLKDRQLLAMYYGAGLNQTEISEMLSMPQRTVSHKLKEALEVLRGSLRRAGYSSTLAIFTDALYRESLLGDASLRSDVGKKIMDVINQAQEAMVSPMYERPPAGGVGRGLGVIMACCVFLAIGVCVPWSQTNRQAALPDSAESESESGLVKEQILSTVPLPKTWIFDPGNRPDIPVKRGQWLEWLSEKGNVPAGVLSPNGSRNTVWLALPVKLTLQPFVVRVSLRAPSSRLIGKHGIKTLGINGFLDSKDTHAEALTRWVLKGPVISNLKPNYSYVGSIYVKGCYQVILRDDYPSPCQIIRYKIRDPHAQFQLGVHGCIVERVTFQNYTEDTFPIETNKWESFTLKPDAQTHLKRLDFKIR